MRYGLVELSVERKGPMTIEELKPGMRVVFIDERLNCGSPGDRFCPPETDAEMLAGREGVVVAVPGVPGKEVAVAFKKKLPESHSCDGLINVPGHGRWVMAAHLYTAEDYIAHANSCAAWAKEQKVAHDIVAEYLSE